MKQPRLKQLGLRNKSLPSRFRQLPKEVDPFYNSTDWYKVRDFVMERDKGLCIDRHLGPCEGRLYVDHIKEIRDGGDRLDPNNLQILCARHHSQKSYASRKKRFAMRY